MDFSPLIELSHAARASSDLPSFMTQAAALVARAVGVECCEIMELLPGSDTLVQRATHGWEAAVAVPFSSPVDPRSPFGRAVRQDAPVLVQVWRYEAGLTLPTTLHDLGVISSFYVRIQGHEYPFGVLGVHRTQPEPFAQDVITVVPLMANLLATGIARLQAEQKAKCFPEKWVRASAQPERSERSANEAFRLRFTPARTEALAAVFEPPAPADSEPLPLVTENARLIAAARSQAVLEERQRLARDLHDSVAQALYSVTLHAEAAMRLLSLNEVGSAREYLQDLQMTAQDALEEMRLLIFELHPPLLEQEGLAAALRARLEAVEQRAHLVTSFVCDGVTDLPPAIEQALYRIVQEGLNNVIKHAKAERISVLLYQEGSRVSLEIRDDGQGFDLAAPRAAGGLGLRGMGERVGRLGGRLHISSAPDTGTSICVELVV